MHRALVVLVILAALPAATVRGDDTDYDMLIKSKAGQVLRTPYSDEASRVTRRPLRR